MTYGWHDLLGNFGVVLVLAIYMLLQLEKLSATGFLYSATNGLGALLILVSLTFEFNLSAFLIEASATNGLGALLILVSLTFEFNLSAGC